MFSTIQSTIKRLVFLKKNEIIVDASVYAELIVKKDSKDIPLSKAKLTQAQLGSYIPDFKDISLQSDEFKNDMGALCKTLVDSKHWNYILNYLKQGQVNTYLFGEVKPSEDWVRGSINGIYVVEDIVLSLGTSYKGSKEPKKNSSKP